MGKAAFLAPLMVTFPASLRPPSMMILSIKLQEKKIHRKDAKDAKIKKECMNIPFAFLAPLR
jgi:hypothetical protein